MKTTIKILIDSDNGTISVDESTQTSEQFYALFGGSFERDYVYCLGNLCRTREQVETEKNKFPAHLQEKITIRRVTVHDDVVE